MPSRRISERIHEPLHERVVWSGHVGGLWTPASAMGRRFVESLPPHPGFALEMGD
jgi:short subunit dehydrogenase-like uncharacterized protein